MSYKFRILDSGGYVEFAVTVSAPLAVAEARALAVYKAWCEAHRGESWFLSEPEQLD